MRKIFIRQYLWLCLALVLVSCGVFIAICVARATHETEVVKSDAQILRNSISVFCTNYLQEIESRFLQNAIILQTIDGTDLSFSKLDYLSVKKRQNIIEYQRAIQYNDENIESVSFYYKEEGMVIATNGIIEKDRFESREALRFIDASSKNTAWYGLSMVKSKDYNKMVPVLSYFRQLPLLTARKTMSLVVNINMSKLSDVIAQYVPDRRNHRVYFVDHQGVVMLDILHDNIGVNMSLYPFIQCALQRDEGQWFGTFGGDRLLSTYSPEAVTGWQLVIVSEANQTRLGIIMLSLLPYFLFALPLLLLVAFISHRYYFLYAARRDSERSRLLTLTLPLLRKKSIADIFTVENAFDEIPPEVLDLLKIERPTQRFTIVAVSGKIDDPLEAAIRQIISNTASISLVWQVDKLVMYLLVFTGRSLESDCRDELKYITDNIKSAPRLSKRIIHIGASNIYDEPNSIRFAQQEARAVIESNVAFGGTKLFPSDLEQQNVWFKFPYDTEKKLTEAIRKGKPNEINDAIDELVAHIKRTTSALQTARRVYMHILCTVLYLLFESYPAYETAFPDRDFETESSGLTTLNELNAWFVAICEEISAHIRSVRSERNIDIMSKLFQYIDANIDNPNISLSVVADNMFFSVSYLSQIFKMETGIGFVDYVQTRRIRKAKELLLTSNLSIQEIASQIGMSTQTIIRVFKKMENMTPGQYRERGLPT